MRVPQSWLLLVFTLSQAAHFVTGDCSLPVTWTRGPWFSHYDSSLRWVVDYSGSLYMYRVVNIKDVVTAGFACLTSSRTSTGHYLLLQNDQRRYCLYIVDTGPALVVLFTPTSSAVSHAEDCEGKFGKSDISWQVKYPLNIQGEACPFSRGGSYQAVIHMDHRDFCVGDGASVVTIDISGQMLINSCQKTNSYAFPVRGARVQCVAHADSAGMDGGDPLLLLTYQEGTLTRFYCARYSVEGTTVHLSLATYDKNKASCRWGMSARPPGQGKLSFTLTGLSASPCGCLFGECMEEAEGHRCLCNAGYTGTHCQTELPRGQCGIGPSPCENGAACQDVSQIFYYCTCLYGFSGVNCEELQACQPNPCAHGGECIPEGSSFQCICRPPYLGVRCEDGQVPVPVSGGGGQNTLVIVLVTLTGGILVAALAISVTVCQRRLRRKEQSLPENPDGEMPKQSSSMQAWYPGYRDNTYSTPTGPTTDAKDLDD